MPSVLCYLHSFVPGGVERMGLRLCRGWLAEGAEVAIVMGRSEGLVRAGGEDQPTYRWLPDPGVSTARFETLWMLIWLPGIVRRARPDILFCAGNSYSVIAVALRLRLGRACPPIVAKISNDLDRHDLPAPARWFYHLWCRIQGRFIHHFTVLSEAMRDEAEQRLGVAASRVTVIPDPVIADAQGIALAEAGRRARASRGPGRRFLAIGRLERQKNLPLLIRAFARGAGPQDRLVILGEGSERRRLVRLVQQLGLTHRVALPGHTVRVADWIARSDVFVLSSDYEGLPAVLIEALAAGMPIIATDCCRSMAETIAAAGRARLVPVRDEAALADAIATFDPAPGGDDAAFLRHFRPETASGAYRRLFETLATASRATIPFPLSPDGADRVRTATCGTRSIPFPLSPDGADRVHASHQRPRDDLATRGARAS